MIMIDTPLDGLEFIKDSVSSTLFTLKFLSFAYFNNTVKLFASNIPYNVDIAKMRTSSIVCARLISTKHIKPPNTSDLNSHLTSGHEVTGLVQNPNDDILFPIVVDVCMRPGAGVVLLARYL